VRESGERVLLSCTVEELEAVAGLKQGELSQGTVVVESGPLSTDPVEPVSKPAPLAPPDLSSCIVAVGESEEGCSAFWRVAQQHTGEDAPRFHHITSDSPAAQEIAQLFKWEALPVPGELRVVLMPGAGNVEAELGGQPGGPSGAELEYFVAVFQRGDFASSRFAPAPGEETRPDPCDFVEKTKEEFIYIYGGTDQWEDANPWGDEGAQWDTGVEWGGVDLKKKPISWGVSETRVDPADGVDKSKREFVEKYGGFAEWDAAWTSRR